jgi:hypothetical protein
MSPTARRIVWAILLSLGIHLFVMFGANLHIPAFKPGTAEFEATLAPLPNNPPIVKPSTPPPKRVRKRLPPPAPKHVASAPAAVQEPHPVQALPPDQTDVAASSQEGTPKEASGGDNITNTPTEAVQPVTPPPKPSTRLPPQVELEYALNKGANGLTVGRVLHIWNLNGMSYSITSVTEATGIFSLIKPGRLVQTSQGEITLHGLEPSSFWIQRGQSAETTESAQFNHAGSTLTFGSERDARTVPLPADTQDLLSFVYQFAQMAPITAPVRLHITNGRKLDTYEYRPVGEETVSTPAGEMRALHLSKTHTPDEDATEIWLAIDHDYLPVKIQQIDKQGDVVEQVVRSIRLPAAARNGK